MIKTINHPSPNPSAQKTDRPFTMPSAQTTADLLEKSATGLASPSVSNVESVQDSRTDTIETASQRVVKGTSDPKPSFTIKLRISCCEDSQGIEVPLGDYREGKWNSQYYELDWESFTEKDVTDWLYWQGIFGFPDEDERLEFNAAAQATLKRCLVLAKAFAKSSKPVAVGAR